MIEVSLRASVIIFECHPAASSSFFQSWFQRSPTKIILKNEKD